MSLLLGVARLRAEPIAILAAGVTTPLGFDLDAFWSGLVTGADGISAIERFRVDDLRVRRGGEIKKLQTAGCRASAFLIAAAGDLLARTRLGAAADRIAIVAGTALGGVEELERALGGAPGPRPAVGALYDSPAHALGRSVGARGPVITVSTACASGATALGVAADLLQDD